MPEQQHTLQPTDVRAIDAAPLMTRQQRKMVIDLAYEKAVDPLDLLRHVESTALSNIGTTDA